MSRTEEWAARFSPTPTHHRPLMRYRKDHSAALQLLALVLGGVAFAVAVIALGIALHGGL